jgi:hypothetical protein
MKQRRAPWQALPRLHVLLRRLHSLLQRLHSLLVGKIDRLFGCKPMVPGFFFPSYWSLFQACPCEPRRPFSQHDGTRSPQTLPSGRVTPCISEGPSAAPYPRSPKIAALASFTPIFFLNTIIASCSAALLSRLFIFSPSHLSTSAGTDYVSTLARRLL